MNPSERRTIAADIAVGEPLEGELAWFFGYSHDLLVVLDQAGQLVIVSPSVERLLGYSVEALVGTSLMSYIHPDEQSAVHDQVQKLRDGRGIPDLDIRFRRADGTWVPVRCSLASGPNGRLYGVGRDRTADIRHREVLLKREMAEFRLRTALELHDGILQTLTGASFQIAVARRLMATDPAAAEEVLEALARSVSAEQQELRLYVDEVKGKDRLEGEAPARLEGRIQAMLQRVALIWGVEAQGTVEVASRFGVEMERQLLRLVQEAVVNAARHGGAGAVSVDVRTTGPDITVQVIDDGHGFSFTGEFDHASLKRQRLGPLSLKHRVDSLGGTIAIHSTPQGATLTIRVPVERETES